MKTLTNTEDQFRIWPKDTSCQHCHVRLSYTQDAVYEQSSFDREGPGDATPYIDCPSCHNKVVLSISREIGKNFFDWVKIQPRKQSAHDSVKIVGNNPADHVNEWPKVIRCAQCKNGLSFDITDIHIEVSFGPDGEFESPWLYIQCENCGRHNELERRTLPADFIAQMISGWESAQTRTGHLALLRGDRAAWTTEITAHWAGLTPDQKFSLSGSLDMPLEERFTVAAANAFSAMPDALQQKIVARISKSPGFWPKI